jgi:hypothetical protein
MRVRDVENVLGWEGGDDDDEVYYAQGPTVQRAYGKAEKGEQEVDTWLSCLLSR